MLTVSSLSKSFGGRTLFSDVTFRLSPGRRIALLGGNGVGKSTLLEIVVGRQEPDGGQVSTPTDYRIGYLPQELLEAWHGTVLEEVMQGAQEVVALQLQLEELGEAIAAQGADVSQDLIEKYGEAQSQYETLGGYQLEAEARRILGGLGFTAPDMDRPLKEMSGGWQMRATLARLLLQKPDVLVLDEPTNHLDVDSVAWLEAQLAGWPGAILFVSHDRDFIDAVAERVVEIAWGTASEYIGGFVEFVAARQERITILEATARRQAKEVERVEKFVDRFRYKATKAKQVQSRIKALEKLETIEVPKIEDLKVKFSFPEPPRSSRTVLDIDSVAVGYDATPILSDVSLIVERGDKLGLVGPNGAGKSTLLKLILGELEPLSGQIKLGSNVDVAYFAQHQVDALDLDKTVEQEFRAAIGDQPKNRNIRTVLGSFGFSGDAVDRRVRDLSGGERTRLSLAEIMCNPVNLLILDEPTNHLDLPSCDLLEDALLAYPGTVLLVSHDRYLVRNTVELVYEVRDGKVTARDDVEQVMFPTLDQQTPPSKRISGTSSRAPQKEGLNKRGSNKRNSTADRRGGGSSTPTKTESSGSSKLSNQELRSLQKTADKLERKAEKAQSRVDDLGTQLAHPDTYNDVDLMTDLLARHAEEQKLAADLVAQWEAAAEKLDG